MDFQLRPVGKTCEKTGQALVPGEMCHSVLVERQGKLTRLDYSHEAWSGPPDDSIANWQIQVPESTEKPSHVLTTDDLMTYFEDLSESPNLMQEKLRYVLALMLLQRRRLKLEGSRSEDEVEFLQLSGSRGDGDFEVRDQALDEEEIEQLQNELNAGMAAGDEE